MALISTQSTNNNKEGNPSGNLNHQLQQDSFSQKLYGLAGNSLRRAATVLLRINLPPAVTLPNQNDRNECINSDLKKRVLNEDHTIPISDGWSIPVPDISHDEESMDTTYSSFDSSFNLPTSESQASLKESVQEELEQDEKDDSIEICSNSLPIITMEEVGEHYRMDDAWMVIYDKVYNFSKFLYQHPGGIEIMQEYIGYDATVAFRGVGHSANALEMMEPYLIGILPTSQRLYCNRCQW